ncbi:MAG: flagellar hook-basal body complex protein [Selenomonadaceae bacterium]|nr:flagellar hook-basal body complex protein [Selenomonadaceae bacterium]
MKAYAYARTSNNYNPESSTSPAAPTANRDYDESSGPRMSESTAFYATMMYAGTSGTNMTTTLYNRFRSVIDTSDSDNLSDYDDYYQKAIDLYNHLQSTAYNSQFSTDGSDMFVVDSDEYNNLLQLIAGWDQDNDPNHTDTLDPMNSFLNNYAIAARLVDYLHALQVGDATSKTTLIVTKDDVDLLDYDTNTDTGVHATATSAYLTLSDGTRQSVTTGTYTVGESVPLTTVITVFDSEGGAHKVPILLTKLGANTWQASLSGAIRERTSGEDNETLRYLTVDEDDGSTTTIRMNPTTFTFDTDGTYLSGSADISFEFTNGAAEMTATVDFSSLSQFDGNNTAYPSADGNKAGVLTSVAIDSSGVITGTYTNGLRQNEAQIAVAQFTNPGGLTKTGNTFWQESNNSGTPNVKTAPDLGISITPSALEMSNVDLANEFSEMIITQRGFQANSKIINVGDEMLETLVNMKR